MFTVFLWYTGPDVKVENLKKIEIPTQIAKHLVGLDKNTYPLLSILSFDDIDLFSDNELLSLLHEVELFVEKNDLNDDLNDLEKLIDEAIKEKRYSI